MGSLSSLLIKKQNNMKYLIYRILGLLLYYIIIHFIIKYW